MVRLIVATQQSRINNTSGNHESPHTQRKHKMFKKFIKWLRTPSFQRDIDAYIASKYPTNTAEVDYWVNQFLLARGAL